MTVNANVIGGDPQGKTALPGELLICGSGASEGIPALFCTCAICRQARLNGGRDIRSRTAYQLGDDIRIDFGPDIYYQREKFQLHFEKLRHLFITHPHKDHFYPVQLSYHIHGEEGPAMLADFPLTLHGTAEVMAQLDRALNGKLAQRIDRMRLVLDELDPVRCVRTLDNGMKFTAVGANHDCAGALNYIVEMPDGFTFFIGTDSGPFTEETWRILAEFRFDLMILDGTGGLLNIENSGHHTGREVLAAAERLRREGIAGPHTRIVTNHFAHCGGMLHADLEKFYAPHGIEPGYDGMRLPLHR